MRLKGKAPTVVAAHCAAIFGLHTCGATVESGGEGAFDWGAWFKTNADRFTAGKIHQQIGCAGDDVAAGIFNRKC